MENKNELALIIKESGLEQTKADFLLTNFQSYFEIASEWEKRAKTIVVKDETHTVEMQLARTGRLFLKEKRIAIENSRKSLKEQSLREGKAIDGIANVLKALIVPIEEYLDSQEHFVEIKQKAVTEQLRIEEEKKLELEIIKKAEEDKKEQERIILENEKLKKEIEKKEKLRIANEGKFQLERQKAETEKRAIEEKAQKEKDKAEKDRKLAQEKAETEKNKLIEEQRIMQEKLDSQIECPHCHKKFTLNK